ncbi:ABC transporter ATP-binding protein [Streptococcus pneumoniae]|uniref:ABC transporter ATP-binding protein n=1 Tax=Streptococcus pneumoniae TaxID=1313 RepID=UPI0007693B42|nr:ABC transporter ATP-binding protein [Streptococcus pneumoniae]VND23570.1 ABC transporter ATP-binding protein/permease [Streptococcus pneumoniae]VQF25984.1 ABC transporter ATP-binding protein/permease [Streptococcus pneumoniae]HEW3553394.1 ABC transporter ATP-binding protein [Streptococcus pneumoniae]
MLIQKIKTYKWQALASLLMTGLMVASSLLQPRYLQEVLGALLTGKYEAIYSIGAWLIGVAVIGLVAGGLNVVLAAYIAQGVSSDLREDAFRKIQTFSYADIEQFNAGNLVVRMTNDINQIQNVVMMTFQILFRLPLLFIGSFILAVQTLPSLWWVIVLMVVLIFGLTAVMMGMMGPRFAKFQTLLERINAIAKENLRGVRVVKSFVQEKEQFAKFTDVSDELLGQNLYIGYAFSVVEPCMEKTFESPVEERGTNFSGGQKQRMSIARGIVSNPRILIFDDSTSALDAKSERLVQEALNKDLKGTTTIIIAQKISSVVHADKILVLNQGRLIGQGTHADLVANNAVYREIYETQK